MSQQEWTERLGCLRIAGKTLVFVVSVVVGYIIGRAL